MQLRNGYVTQFPIRYKHLSLKLEVSDPKKRQVVQIRIQLPEIVVVATVGPSSVVAADKIEFLCPTVWTGHRTSSVV